MIDGAVRNSTGGYGRNLVEGRERRWRAGAERLGGGKREQGVEREREGRSQDAGRGKERARSGEGEGGQEPRRGERKRESRERRGRGRGKASREGEKRAGKQNGKRGKRFHSIREKEKWGKKMAISFYSLRVNLSQALVRTLQLSFYCILG